MKHIRTILIYVLVLAVCLLIYRVFLIDKVLVVGDFTGSDLLDMHLPYKYVVHEALTRGTIPLWIDSLSNGMPFLAEGQAGVLYPVNLLLAWFDPVDGLMLSMFAAVMVAGFGMYGYLRAVFKLGVLSALLGAVAFACSSIIVFRIKHLNYVHAISLLPLVAWCLFRWREHFSWWRGVGVAVVLALVAYTGAPPFLYYYVLFVWFYMGGWAVFRWFKKRDIRLGRVLLGLLSVCGLAFLLAAPQLLPTLEFTFFTSRNGGVDDYLSNVAFPFHPVFYATFFAPYLLGNPADGSYLYPISSFGVWWENVLYIGLLPIFFALVGIGLWGGGKWKKRETVWRKLEGDQSYELWLLGVLGIVFAYISWGRLSVLHLFLHTVAPGFSYFRFPQRFHVFVIFVLCVVSAVFVSLLQKFLVERYRQRKWLIQLVLGIGIVLTVVDFGWVYSQYFVVVERGVYASVKPPVEVLESGKKVYSLVQYYANPYAAGWQDRVEEIVRLQYGLPGDNAVRFGLDSFSNRNWFEGGLVLQERFDREESILFDYADTCEGMVEQLRMWSVGYVSAVEGHGVVYGKIPELSCMRLVERKGNLVWYAVGETLPQAYLTDVADESGERWDLRDSVLERQPDKKVYRVSVAEERLLVLNEYDYSGWEVYVDGVVRDKYKHAQKKKAVVVPAGEHVVEWRYVPKSFYAGLGIMIIGVIAVGLPKFIRPRRSW